MNLKRKIMLSVLLAIAFFSTISYGANDDQFSHDYTRANTLRKSKDIKGIQDLVKEIQREWSQKDKRKYGDLMVKTLNSWASACRQSKIKPPLNIIRQHASQVLSTYDHNRSDNISIQTEFDLVSILHEEYEYSKGKRTDKEWSDARRNGSDMWFKTWRRLEDAIDDKWDSNILPVANVVPPKGVAGISFPGMSPEMIKDPIIRAEYERAIRKNREKVKIRNEQLKLRGIKNRYRRVIERYLVSTYSIPPYANKELEKYLNKYVAEEKTRANIIDEVTKKIEKQSQKQKEPNM